MEQLNSGFDYEVASAVTKPVAATSAVMLPRQHFMAALKEANATKKLLAKAKGSDDAKSEFGGRRRGKRGGVGRSNTAKAKSGGGPAASAGAAAGVK